MWTVPLRNSSGHNLHRSSGRPATPLGALQRPPNCWRVVPACPRREIRELARLRTPYAAVDFDRPGRQLVRATSLRLRERWLLSAGDSRSIPDSGPAPANRCPAGGSGDPGVVEGEASSRAGDSPIRGTAAQAPGQRPLPALRRSAPSLRGLERPCRAGIFAPTQDLVVSGGRAT